MMIDMVPIEPRDGRHPVAVAPAVVEARFAQRGYTPPPAYVAFAVANGGTSFPSAFRYVRNKDTGEVIGVMTVYHYDGSFFRSSVDDVWEQTDPQLPHGLVPIASTEFGGQICLDYRGGRTSPSVVLYDFEAIPGEEVGRIADSFDAFLAEIGPKPVTD
jgi:hypothetical protein